MIKHVFITLYKALQIFEASAVGNVHKLRVVRIKKLTYVWDEEREEFIKLAGMDKGLTKLELHQFQGYNEYQQLLRRTVYGLNEIPVEVQSLMTLLFLEIINPFYIFQVFSLCVWLSDHYYYYPIAIVLMSALGISTTIIQTRKNQKKLRDTVHSSDSVTVWRGEDRYEEIPTTMLVPGDVIVIPAHGCDMHCDAVLLSGTCIVNESMLTGESVPVNKTALPRQADVLYYAKEDANHTLFCGTKVIQTRFYGQERVKAVVLRTGFLTAKGSLVRAILYPPPADFRFDQDSYKFIGILAVIALIGLIYTIIVKVKHNIEPGMVALNALDLFTIVIPPALPAALSVGKMFAQKRLQKHGIYCINSRVINVAGGINCVCFDKTGTLTEDGMDMWGVLPVKNKNFQEPEHDVKQLQHHILQLAMASCHSLTLIDGTLSGDPLDIKIPLEVGLVHQFQFSSTLQRMSIVTRTLGSQDFVLYCKGSPEMIVSLSKPETVPVNWATTLQQYTEKGYRVIAMGMRTLVDTSYTKLQRMRREDAEYDLEFLGLIILENRLKPQTTEMIHVLKEAKFNVVMITGDNILTALSVAKECGIISPMETIVNIQAVPAMKDVPAKISFTAAPNGKKIPQQNGLSLTAVEEGFGNNNFKLALTGATWAIIKDEFQELVPRICARGAVFARMSSEQKQQLVQELQTLGYCVAMCGDGANDCGALKAAHVGISLSEAECSVASPFTSKEDNISCVARVVREGRGALSTSSGVFRFMVSYSITEFLSCVILYAVDSNLTDLQFLFIDVALIVNFAFFFGMSKSYKGNIVPEPPLTTLLSFIPLASITLHIFVIVCIQLSSFYIVRQFPWYSNYKKADDSYTCYENYAIYTVSLFQYIASAIVFSQGKPYRQEIYTNYLMIASLIIMTIFSAYKTLYPPTWILDPFEYILPTNFDFRTIVICLAIVNFIVTMFVEKVFVNWFLVSVVKPFWTKKTGLSNNKRYLAVEEEIEKECWPPIDTQAPSLRASVTELHEPAKTLDIQMKMLQESGGMT
ncbi:putative cation-transporting ATPase 13A3 [Blattella germanica]|nr:putative cation-transporting ATPase 13A3 [Blattella germanica]